LCAGEPRSRGCLQTGLLRPVVPGPCVPGSHAAGDTCGQAQSLPTPSTHRCGARTLRAGDGRVLRAWNCCGARTLRAGTWGGKNAHERSVMPTGPTRPTPDCSTDPIDRPDRPTVPTNPTRRPARPTRPDRPDPTDGPTRPTVPTDASDRKHQPVHRSTRPVDRPDRTDSGLHHRPNRRARPSNPIDQGIFLQTNPTDHCKILEFSTGQAPSQVKF